MTNRAGRPDQTRPRGRWAGWSSPVWLLVLGVWLGSLLNVALNTATNATRPYPGPLRLLQEYPWQAAALLTLILAVLAWRQHERAAASQPQRGGPLPGVLTLRREEAPTAAELGGLRRELLEQVRRTWVQGVLDRSLAQVARVELGLAEQPGAVAHPWGALLRQPDEPDQAFPPGTSITAVAALFDRQLLILGGPGAGKTTLLLEYTRDLLEQAERDAAAPIPVVFHLSAWPAEQPPLEGWLVEELALRYGVARRLAVELVARDWLAVLLDGLDEVPQVRRAACVAAINAFRGEHGGVPLVVCARSRDYRELAARLALRGAVVVQPLDRGQVVGWLAAAGRPLAGLRVALRDHEHWLWGLLDSPLLLLIATLTYKSQPASAVRGHGSVESLLGTYVDAMLARPRAPLAASQDQVAYADADTLRWLGWLAERMGEQSMFYPDWMQSDWLPTRRQAWLATTGLGLAAAVTGALAMGFFGLAIGWFGPVVSLASTLFFTLAFGLVFGLAMGLTRQGSRIEPMEPTRWSWSRARHGLGRTLVFELAAGLVIGPVAGLIFGLIDIFVFGLIDWLVIGLTAGLAGGLATALTRGFESRPNMWPAAPLEGIHAAVRVGRNSGLVVGLVIGLGVGLVELGGRLIHALVGGVVFGLAAGLAAGLRKGGASYLRHRLLVVLLRRQGLIPVDLIGFLDYADSRILLRRAGGGYLFIHRLLQDYFRNHAHQTGPSHATSASDQQAATVQ